MMLTEYGLHLDDTMSSMFGSDPETASDVVAPHFRDFGNSGVPSGRSYNILRRFDSTSVVAVKTV